MYSRENKKKMLRLINFCKLARLYLLFYIQGVAPDFYFVKKNRKIIGYLKYLYRFHKTENFVRRKT